MFCHFALGKSQDSIELVDPHPQKTVLALTELSTMNETNLFIRSDCTSIVHENFEGDFRKSEILKTIINYQGNCVRTEPPPKQRGASKRDSKIHCGFLSIIKVQNHLADVLSVMQNRPVKPLGSTWARSQPFTYLFSGEGFLGCRQTSSLWLIYGSERLI